MQAGGPPILIGGIGEQRTLKLVARYADLSHRFTRPLDELLRKNEVLERHCQAEGRDSRTITKLVGAPVLLSANDSQARELDSRMPLERRAI